MLHLRRHIGSVIGVLALAALVVPPTVMARGIPVRTQLIRSTTAPVGGSVTQQELPGCSNPSEPFVGPSQGCPGSMSGREAMIRSRSGHKLIFDDGPLSGSRGPRHTISLDGSFARGPRQTTSLDGSINPETGGLVVDSVSRTKGFGFIKEEGGSERTYNSALASTSGVMGYGWSFPYSMSMRIYRGTATIIQENGSQIVFKRGADKRFHAAPRVIASLEQSSAGSYTLTRGSSRSSCPSYLLQSCVAFTFRSGHLSRISPAACKSTEVCGNGVVDISRDSKGRPTSVLSGAGSYLTFRYTAGHITSITGSDGVSEQFTYDSRGNLSSATDPNGNQTRFTYDAAHRLTGVRDPLGRITRYLYDASGRVTTVTDPLGHETAYHYNGASHTTTITSPEGRRVVLSYQARELVDVAAGPAAPPLAEWTFAYDPTTLAVTEAVDARLHKVHAVHNGDGRPLALTDALGHTTTFTYSDTGRRSSVTDPMGVKTKFTYDENGNVLTRSTPNTSSGTTRVVTWISVFEDASHPGDMTASIDPLGNETDYTYDARGNPASVTDPLGNTWTYSIHRACLFSIGRKGARRSGGTPGDTITDPLGHTTTYTCDANGNLLTTTDAGGATTTNTYDADHELTSSTDPAGRTTTYSYDADGRLTAVHMPGGATSRATYGADGEMTSSIDPAGGTRSFTYDDLGRMVSSTDQLSRTTTFAYDAVGNVTASTDAMGVTATNTYDGDNRLLSTSYSDGATPTVSYAYDANGRRTSMTDGPGTTTYQYDSLGRVTLVIDESGSIVDPEYDLAGNRTSLKYPNGHTVTMQYDGNGQMTGVTDWLGNTTQFQYDQAGRPHRMLKIRVGFPAGATTTWGFDSANQLLHIQVRDAYGNSAASFDYTRASDGRITSVHSTGLGDSDHSYGYGIQARLGSYDGAQVSFDSRNNVTHLSDGSDLTYDAADQLTSVQGSGLLTPFTYDADGQRTGSSSAASSLSFAWSGAGDLTSFSDNGTTTSYTTNGDGQRTSSSGGGVAHTFTWDSAASHGSKLNKDYASDPYVEDAVKNNGEACDPGGEDFCAATPPFIVGHDPPSLLSDGTNSYIYGPDGRPIEQIDNTDHALFLDEDAQGSVRLITDADGNVEGTASYDAFGNQTAQSGETSPFGYHGMYLDSESGLYALSGSVYDPPTGQNLASNRNGVRVINGRTSNSSARADCRSGEGCGNGYCKSTEVCGNGIAKSVQWEPHKSPGLDDPDLTLTPYGVPGGDPVNGRVKKLTGLESETEVVPYQG